MRRLFCLLLPLLLLLTACGSRTETEPTQASVSFDSLAFTKEIPLLYAESFSVSYSEAGYGDIRIGTEQRFLLVPAGQSVPEGVPAAVTVLCQPLDKLYLVSSSAMDYFRELGCIDRITLSSQKQDSWYIPEAAAAMASGAMQYAGKYSTPDYEQLLAGGCRLAIENTMIYHTPEVLEQLSRLGIPALVERSSYEQNPLGRMEWLKLYAALMDKNDVAQAFFDRLETDLTPILQSPATGKTVVFFSVTSTGAVTVRSPGDYVSKAVSMAGGTPVAFRESESGQSTQTLQMESFYALAKDADVLIYNGTIEGEVTSLNDLLVKCPLLADFTAVKTGSVWCAGKNLFQQPLGLGDLILDIHSVLTEEAPASLRFLTHLT